MGIETVVLLLEQSCLDDLLSLTWGELYQGMEKGNFRQSRPEVDERLNRLFDIDCCLLYTSPSPRDRTRSRMPSSA